MKLICFGDSITAANGFAEADRWPSVLQRLLEQRAPGVYKVYNRGIGGNTSVLGFDRLETDVFPLLPGTVLVEFGFNDAHCREWSLESRVGLAEFRAKLREFHRVFAARQSATVYIVNHPIGDVAHKQGNGKRYRDGFAPYNEAVREVAREVGAPAIDLPALLAARGTDLATFLAPTDQLHLSPGGNHVYAEVVCAELVRFGIVA